MSEAVVKRISFLEEEKNENGGRECDCWIRVARWVCWPNTSRGNVVLGDAVLPGRAARDHCGSLGGNDWKALLPPRGSYPTQYCGENGLAVALGGPGSRRRSLWGPYPLGCISEWAVG